METSLVEAAQQHLESQQPGRFRRISDPTFHPAAALFPLLRDSDPVAWSQFVADVREHGVLEPIVMVGDQIVDGRNRFLAAVEAGERVPAVPYVGRDPVAYVLSANLHRRHLTTSQRAMVAASLANMRQGHRSDLEPGPKSDEVSLQQAADMLNVARSTVADAKAVMDESPELADKVRSGDRTVGAAKRELRPPTCAHGYPVANCQAIDRCCVHGRSPLTCMPCQKFAPGYTPPPPGTGRQNGGRKPKPPDENVDQLDIEMSPPTVETEPSVQIVATVFRRGGRFVLECSRHIERVGPAVDEEHVLDVGDDLAERLLTPGLDPADTFRLLTQAAL